MAITLQTLHFTATDHLKDFVNEKVSKLFDHGTKIEFADVTLFETAEPHNNKYCEIRLGVPNSDHFAKRNSPSFEQSVLETVEALQKSMRRHHDKVVDHHRSDQDINEAGAVTEY